MVVVKSGISVFYKSDIFVKELNFRIIFQNYAKFIFFLSYSPTFYF